MVFSALNTGKYSWRIIYVLVSCQGVLLSYFSAALFFGDSRSCGSRGPSQYNARVVFPLRGTGKPPRRKSPKNGEKLQNSPPRSDPQKWGKNCPKNYKNCIFGVILPLFWGNFPHFRGSEWGGEFCNFSPFFRDFRPGGFPGPLRGKTTRKSQCNAPSLHTVDLISSWKKGSLGRGRSGTSAQSFVLCFFLCSEVIFSCKSHRNFFQKLPLQCRHFLENPLAKSPKTQLLIWDLFFCAFGPGDSCGIGCSRRGKKPKRWRISMSLKCD